MPNAIAVAVQEQPAQPKLVLEQKSQQLRERTQGRRVEPDPLARAPNVRQRVLVLLVRRVPEHVREQQPAEHVALKGVGALPARRQERALPNCHTPRPLLQSPGRELLLLYFVSLPSLQSTSEFRIIYK